MAVARVYIHLESSKLVCQQESFTPKFVSEPLF